MSANKTMEDVLKIAATLLVAIDVTVQPAISWDLMVFLALVNMILAYM